MIHPHGSPPATLAVRGLRVPLSWLDSRMSAGGAYLEGRPDTAQLPSSTGPRSYIPALAQTTNTRSAACTTLSNGPTKRSSNALSDPLTIVRRSEGARHFPRAAGRSGAECSRASRSPHKAAR